MIAGVFPILTRVEDFLSIQPKSADVMDLTAVLKDGHNVVMSNLKVPANGVEGGGDYNLKDLEVSLRTLQAEVNSILTGLLDKCEETDENCDEDEEDDSEDGDCSNGTKRKLTSNSNSPKKLKNS